MAIGTMSLSSTKTVLDNVTGNGAVGVANDSIDNAALKLLKHSDELALGGDTRLEKFADTVHKFFDGGVAVGAIASDAVMFPYDVVAGRGGKHPGAHSGQKFLDHGIAGLVVKGTVASVGFASEVVGYAGGYVAGTVTGPVKHVGDGEATTIAMSASNGGNDGATFAAATTTHILGTPGGIALDIVRIPSLAVKYTVSGITGILGGAVGVVAGAGRAIFS